MTVKTKRKNPYRSEVRDEAAADQTRAGLSRRELSG